MIPNILHFVFLTGAEHRTKTLSLSHYISVKSAVMVNSPEACYFHYNYEPGGKWWGRIKEMVIPNRVNAPDSFKGRKLYHVAHKSDVIRLQILYETGGIYMDLDTISVKPLTELLTNKFVMGKELKVPYTPKNNRQRIKLAIRKKLGMAKHLLEPETGLCNAVLLAEKNSEFIRQWMEEYRSFRSKGRDKFWNEHSGKIPLKLADQYPGLATLVSPYCFHYPLYTPEGMSSMFEKVTVFPEAYLHHLWESFSGDRYLSKLTVDEIINHDTTYNLIARKYL